MIPGAFDYHRPSTLPEAAKMLADLGEDARVLAGGHSLIPMMKLRMAQPAHLIDLQDIAEMKGIAIDGGTIRLGAMVTQHEIIDHAALTRACPILSEAALQIADPQVRYVGTVGGNVANGDPGNDMPGLMQCLDARYELTGPGGTRIVPARGFYQSAYFTERAEEEILSAVLIPVPATGHGYAYEKQKRKIGDYATAAAAVTISSGTASIAMTNLADTPIWSDSAGQALASGDVEGAVAAALDAIDPVEDMRGPVEFKKHVAGVMLHRAIATAQSRLA